MTFTSEQRRRRVYRLGFEGENESSAIDEQDHELQQYPFGYSGGPGFTFSPSESVYPIIVPYQEDDDFSSRDPNAAAHKNGQSTRRNRGGGGRWRSQSRQEQHGLVPERRAGWNEWRYPIVYPDSGSKQPPAKRRRIEEGGVIFDSEAAYEAKKKYPDLFPVDSLGQASLPRKRSIDWPSAVVEEGAATSSSSRYPIVSSECSNLPTNATQTLQPIPRSLSRTMSRTMSQTLSRSLSGISVDGLFDDAMSSLPEDFFDEGEEEIIANIDLMDAVEDLEDDEWLGTPKSLKVSTPRTLLVRPHSFQKM